MPKISVVLPTYNGQEYIKEAIESIINQTFEDWELIIVNDCSTDETGKIIEEYREKDSRIRIINNYVNKKLPASLNVGFLQATGEYLTWTSDDNMYLPNALKIMTKYLDQNPKQIMVRARYNVINEEKEVLYVADEYDQDIGYIRNCVGACFLYRKEVVEKIGYYNENKFLVEDYDYWLRILFQYGEIGQICDVLYLYRTHKCSLTSTRERDIRKMLLKLRKEYIQKLVLRLSHRKDLLCEIYYDFKMDHMLDFEVKELITTYVPEVKMDCGNVESKESIVYGAGEYGKLAYDRYASIIKYYADKNKCGEYLFDRKIISINEMRKLKDQYQILIAASSHNIYSFLRTLEENTIDKCVVLSWLK